MLKFMNRKNRLVNTLTDEGFKMTLKLSRTTYLFEREAYGIVTHVLVWGSVFFPQKTITVKV